MLEVYRFILPQHVKHKLLRWLYKGTTFHGKLSIQILNADFDLHHKYSGEQENYKSFVF